MTNTEKIQIIEALIDIKLVLKDYNNMLDVNNLSDADYISYEPLSKAFVGVDIISLIIQKS